MSIFSGPTEHAANPPETWKVEKVADHHWRLTTKDGTVLDSFTSMRRAEDAKVESFWTQQYERDARWYAGHTPPGHKPWATVKAEREATVLRLAERGRAGLTARVERLTRQIVSYYRNVSPDPVPADVVEWARWYGKTYPGLMGDDLTHMVEQIDADRAEISRTDALVADFAA